MTLRKHQENFTWDDTEILKYKEDGTHFKNISRQVLFSGQADLPTQLRYFEIAPGGYSTLERHQHLHVVMVVRGRGQALLGTEILTLTLYDVLHIPPHTWHQFQATTPETFGFLCLVPLERDKPERPNEEQRLELTQNPVLAKFINT